MEKVTISPSRWQKLTFYGKGPDLLKKGQKYCKRATGPKAKGQGPIIFPKGQI